MTIYGKDEEEKECIGGPLHDEEDRAGDEEATPLDVSESVNIDGITNTDLVVDLYAAKGCPPESWLTQIESDSCYTSSEGVSTFQLRNQGIAILIRNAGPGQVCKDPQEGMRRNARQKLGPRWNSLLTTGIKETSAL